MNNVKAFGLAVIAAAAILAFIGSSSASATALCTTNVDKAHKCPATETVTHIHAVSVGTLKLTTSFKNIECTEGTHTSEGTNSESGPATGTVTSLTFGGCNCTVTVLAGGTISVTQIGETNNGTVSSSGAEVTASCSTIFGNVHCIYATNATDLGTLEGGPDAHMTVSANIPRLTTSGLCAEKATWDATYTITNHTAVYTVPGGDS